MSLDYEACVLESERFYGSDCCDKFCNWLFREENKYCTVLAHNQGGYDGKFILSWMLRNQLPPKTYIQQGSRITYMTTHKFYLRFVDTLNFFLCPLSDLSATYGIIDEKGYFPHHFNIVSNQKYIGLIPDESEFGARSMTPKKYKEFKKWHDEYVHCQGHFWDFKCWNFKKEFNKYCMLDVDVLAQAVLKFRDIFEVRC
jgi:hypothetical protein